MANKICRSFIGDKAIVVAAMLNWGTSGAASTTVLDAAGDPLDEVIVSATRTAQNVDTVPASASVLTASDLDRQVSNSLQEAIKYEAGVYDGKLRGLPSESQTLVMLNGMPLNSGWFGGVRWSNISMENVERVEIVRGPGSALYGGNAMGGTINVITSLPDEFEVGLKTRVGSNDNLSYGGHIGDRLSDNFALRLGVEVDDELVGYANSYVQRTLSAGTGTLNGGFYMPTRDNAPAWIVGDLGIRHESQWSVNLAARLDVSDTASMRFDGQLGYDDYATDAPRSYVRDAAGNAVYAGNVNAGVGQRATLTASNFLTGAGAEDNGSYMTTYTDQFGGVELVGKLGFQHENKWYTTPNALTGQDFTNAGGDVRTFDTDTYFLDVQTIQGVGERNRLTAGIYGRLNVFDQGKYLLSYYRNEDSRITGKTELTQGTDRYYAAYLQDEWTAIEGKLNFYAGARFDHWTAYDGLSGNVDNPSRLPDISNSALTPKLSAVLTPIIDTIIKVSAGQAFRAPTIYDLYRTYEVSSGRMSYSNPDLQPEKLWNYEVGVVQYFSERMIKLESTLFRSDINNLIYSYSLNNNTYKDNAGAARIQGIELAVAIKPIEGLNIWANYTFNDSEILKQTKDPAMVGKRVTSMPDRTINTGVDVGHKVWQTSLSGRYIGRIYKTQYNTDITDVYTATSNTWLWDLKATAKWQPQQSFVKALALSAAVQNLFDKEYFDYYIGRARSYFVELKASW